MRRDELLPTSPSFSFFGTNSQQKNLNRKEGGERNKEKEQEIKEIRPRINPIKIWIQEFRDQTFHQYILQLFLGTELRILH